MVFPPDLDVHFPRYERFGPAVAVWCVTPDSGRTIHRFFDTSPFSPSGRFLGLTRLPCEDRLPRPGEVAQVVVVDLRSGDSHVVAETRAWDTQLGAQVQWGAEDSQLFFNDLDTRTWRAHGVKLDPSTGARMDLEGPVYAVSPDGESAASPCLRRISAVQPGYGVIVPPGQVPVNRGAPADDGIHVTSTITGRSRLLVSLRDIVEATRPQPPTDGSTGGGFYAFHVKWSPRGERLQLVLCRVSHDPSRPTRVRRQLVTMRADGSDICLAVPSSEWDKGGNHPNWCPDGEHVMMNLRLDREHVRFVRAHCDGSGLAPIVDAIPGSGHPTLHPDGRHILTDAYPHEPVAFGDGTVPIRLVDVEAGTERTLVRIQAVPPYSGPRRELRVDPHPAWDRDFRRIAFNGCPDGTRRVYVGDLSGEVAWRGTAAQALGEPTHAWPARG